MDTIINYQVIVEEKLGELSLSESPKGLYDPIRYVLGLGGKRLRPAVCMAVCHFYSGNGFTALNAALGLEVFHNFTLLHDDIMDNSPIRRNRATVHKKWDNNTAILSGDAMMIVASRLMLDVPDRCLSEVQQLYLQTALEVCEGQQFDMDFESSQTVSTFEYLEMIRLKTAVLLAVSMKIGAIIGGANAKDAEMCYLFGQELGLAFQLQDDFLDVFGNEQEFGKSIGNDIVTNKKTFLLISCLERCNKEQQKELLRWITVDQFDREDKIRAVKALFETLGIAQLAKEKMDFYFQNAMKRLDQMNINEASKNELSVFAEKLINRTR
jgi:geranylgeranyl diphosphate synthase type II